MEQASRNNEEIMPFMKRWLNDVEQILVNVQEMQQKVEMDGKDCFKVSLRYSLAKEMDHKAKQMIDLKHVYFERDFVHFKSRKSTYNDLLEAIKGGYDKMIGLYGISGSGKTTLAKEVGKEVHDLKLFEKVIMVVVSKAPNVVKLQQEIAEQIGLKFQEKSPFVRVQRLSNELKNKKILIILDDVWECLNLEEIGIPLVEGCHILLTTCLTDVMDLMRCTCKIELSSMTKEEAWNLFKKHANLHNDASNMFDDTGRKIVDECNGLPIAIVVVGSSLRGKNIEAWKSALWILQSNVRQGLGTAYACLNLSYSSLPSSTAKSLFLLCSMFPEDQKIHKEDLIQFGMRTLDLEESIVTIEDARRVIFDALQILLDSSLLMSIEKEACVKMHNLVQEVALMIAEKQGQAILVGSNKVPNILLRNREILKDTKAMSLWDLDDNFNLSDQLHCPKLEILLLQPHRFIEDLGAIKALKVLALREYGFEGGLRKGFESGFQKGSSVCSIPQSIVSLTYLHTLCIRGKILGDISLLGELKTLEILDLRGSLFDELPVGIVDMKMLKLLDIYDCRIEKSPIEVIGKCEQLEELYFLDHRSIIPHNFSLSRLKRYVLYDSTCSIIGAYEDDPFQEYLESCGEALRALCIQGFRVSALNSSMKNLILRANHLWLDNCEWDHEDINLQINHLGVSCCQEKRFIIEKPGVNILQKEVFSHLITLRLFEMNSLEQMFQDSIQIPSFHRLEEIRLYRCPRLRNMFTLAIVTSLPELRKLDVRGCNEWEGIFCEQSLKNLSTPSTSVFFPKLVTILIWNCHKVRRVFSYSLASHCPSLKKITIGNCCELEGVVEAYDGEVAAHDQTLFPKLNYLRLWDLPKLREIYEGYESNHLSSTIIIKDCPNISKIPLEDKPSSSGS
ncbi:probable disease resistance protein At1g12290 [Neltuma alba]|uniref:probable disease resistance protein At1g12290 n=1 Tax=Neltuma alba TaxID=207710 RepID=UPI0010A54EFC|nr:probable disease resistance protein At1g12290 [Prosopis alba]